MVDHNGSQSERTISKKPKERYVNKYLLGELKNVHKDLLPKNRTRSAFSKEKTHSSDRVTTANSRARTRNFEAKIDPYKTISNNR